VVAHIKSNVGELEESELWVVRPVLLPAKAGEPEVHTARVEREGTSTHSGRSLLVVPNEEDRDAVSEAKVFLEAELSAGSVPSKDVDAGAKAAGISIASLKRAKKALGVKAERVGYGGSGVWMLTLPPKGLNPINATDTDTVEPLCGNPHGYAENGGVEGGGDALRRSSSGMTTFGVHGGDSTAVDRVRELASRAADILRPIGYDGFGGLDGWAEFVEACDIDARKGGDPAKQAVSTMESALAAINGSGS